MASPLFQRYYKRYIVQKLDAKSGVWQNIDSFGTPARAEQFMRQMVNQTPLLRPPECLIKFKSKPLSNTLNYPSFAIQTPE